MKKPHLIVDVALCQGCNNCFLACKDEHVGNDWPGYSRPQSSLGERWIQIPCHERGQYPRFSFHTHHDGKGGALNDISDHRIEIDGYHYWIARINPVDAEARGIEQHDLIRLHNDRGGVICAAVITERVRPGLVHSYESSAVYDPTGIPGYSDDRGGCVNLLTPSRMQIKRSHATAANSWLIQVEKAPAQRDPAEVSVA